MTRRDAAQMFVCAALIALATLLMAVNANERREQRLRSEALGAMYGEQIHVRDAW